MEEVNKVVQKLIDREYRISFAESCTGGLCCAELVGVADASKVLDVSFTTYANEAKVNFIGVNADTIEKYGVVSEEVAKEMCVGVAKTAGSNIGMVCFGFYIDGNIKTFTKQFGALGRNNVRNASVNFVFKTLNELL